MNEKYDAAKFDDFLENTAKLAVIQRIQRIVSVLASMKEVSSEIAPEIFAYAKLGRTNLTALSDFADRYAQCTVGDDSYYMASAILSNECLSNLNDDEYFETVFFVLESLRKLGMPDHLFFKSIILDLGADAIEAELRAPG